MNIFSLIKRHINFILFSCFISPIFIAYIDYKSGLEYDLHLLYLIPIGCVSWKKGKIYGLLISIYSSVFWAISIKEMMIYSYSLLAFIWSLGIKIIIFFTFSLLISYAKKYHDKIIELTAIKSRFLSIASHDLRAPFTSILGYSELILRNTQTNAEQKHFIEMIIKSAEIQLKYIDSLIHLLLTESKNINLNLEEKNISVVINNAVSSLKILSDNKNIQIETKIAENIIVLIDEVKIHQVIVNLLSNAIKFSHSGSIIKIESLINENNIEIHFIDSGTGISDKTKELIFKNEKIKSSSGTKGESGTGLGLMICKNIVELHKGIIRVESKQGEGSDFWFSLPII